MPDTFPIYLQSMEIPVNLGKKNAITKYKIHTPFH